MDRSDVPVGHPVIFRISNEGSIDHNIILEKSGAIGEPLLYIDGNPSKIANMNLGKTFELRLSTENGAEYGFAFLLECPQSGHYEAGIFQEFNSED